MKKIFLITIDTEGDNQWDTSKGISTENAKFLPRFQELSEKYSFKPVWLVNYEMAQDDFFVKYFKEKQDKNLCEIGMHLHAWNNPPEYKLTKINDQRDYLIEYPEDIMDKKIKNLTDLLTKKFGVRPISHRSGRWATNDSYFKLLKKYGYEIDCSVTPHISWHSFLGSTGVNGTNYSNYPEHSYLINEDILEVPMTIRRIHIFEKENVKTVKGFCYEIYRFICGRYQWLRPDNKFSFKKYAKLIKKCVNRNEDIMFMIHSSELMAGGSPSFKTKDDIEKLYEIIEQIFKYANNNGYVGMTLKEYRKFINRDC